jgi:dihydroflavonol-4-reductase
VVEGIINASEKGERGECYILSGEYHSVHDMLSVMEDITAIKAPRARIPRWIAYATSPFAELHYHIHHQKPLFTAYSIATLSTNSDFSSAKAMKVLGYTVTPFRKTMEDTIIWMRDHKLVISPRMLRKAKRRGSRLKRRPVPMDSAISP